MHNLPHVLASQIVWLFFKSVYKTRKTNFFARTEKISVLKISNVLYCFPLSNIILSRHAVKFESNYGSSKGRCCFWCFLLFLSKILKIIFFMSKKWSGANAWILSNIFISICNIDPATMVIRHFKNIRFFC